MFHSGLAPLWPKRGCKVIQPFLLNNDFKNTKTVNLSFKALGRNHFEGFEQSPDSIIILQVISFPRFFIIHVQNVHPQNKGSWVKSYVDKRCIPVSVLSSQALKLRCVAPLALRSKVQIQISRKSLNPPKPPRPSPFQDLTTHFRLTPALPASRVPQPCEAFPRIVGINLINARPLSTTPLYHSWFSFAPALSQNRSEFILFTVEKCPKPRFGTISNAWRMLGPELPLECMRMTHSKSV